MPDKLQPTEVDSDEDEFLACHVAWSSGSKQATDRQHVLPAISVLELLDGGQYAQAEEMASTALAELAQTQNSDSRAAVLLLRAQARLQQNRAEQVCLLACFPFGLVGSEVAAQL